MTQERALIVANWKANLPPGEEVALAGSIATALTPSPKVDVVLAPSMLGLVAVTSLLRREHPTCGISTAAQDCSANENGAHTGEVPAAHLVGIADAVIVGHSERRREQGESDARVGEKAARAVLAGLRPILCLGDDLLDGDDASRAAALAAQWRGAANAAAALGIDVPRFLAAGLVVAYEPVWAIGSGRPATAEQAHRAAATIRSVISADLTILYGGSVDAVGASTFLAQRGITAAERLNGLLVGGAALDAARFAEIVAMADTAA